MYVFGPRIFVFNTILTRSDGYVISGRAYLGGPYSTASSSSAWALGQGIRCSYWSGAPLVLNSSVGSHTVKSIYSNIYYCSNKPNGG